jgi:TM2 domain-containing membrane protein YozV
MNIMNRYNVLSENAFSVYLGCILAGIVVAVFVQSTWILTMLMILQLVYIIPVGFVMFTMYERSKRYWQEKDVDTLQKKYI